jgi:hypothetical protein
MAFSLMAGWAIGYKAWTPLRHINKPVSSSLVSKVPLLPGRSEFCHELCQEFLDGDVPKRITTHEKFSKELSMIWNDPQTPELEEFHNLVRNCKLRAKAEDLLRKEQGGADPGPIEIPSPGVLSVLARQTSGDEKQSRDPE